ncbi:MAG TPA: PAS domain-containing protein, partial [Gallionella sp.]|nr:PAS domain-containing protein [Gallionella sp.]
MLMAYGSRDSLHPRSTVWFAPLLFCLFVSGAAHASGALEAWRGAVTALRTEAENDAPRAYKDALRLQAQLPANATPADRVRIVNLLARIEVYTAQSGAAAEHAAQALELARQNRDRVGQAEAYLNISLNSVNQGRIDALVDATPRALEVLQGVNRPDLLGEAMLRLSMMSQRIGQFDESVTLCMQAMDIAKRSNNPLALLYAHQCLGISYDQSGNDDVAHQHFTQMRDLSRTLHLKQMEADAISGLAGTLEKQADWHASEMLHREALRLYREAGVPFNVAQGLFGLAFGLRQHGHQAESLPPLGEAISIYERFSNKIGLWGALNARSENLQALGRFVAARADAERAYALAKDIGMPVYRSGSARRMSAIFAAAGEPKRAYEFAVEAIDFADETAREKSGTRMAELAQRYQEENRQRQVDELTLHNEQQDERQRWLWTVLGGSIVLLAGTAYFLLRLRKSREEIRSLNIDLEQRVEAQTSELRQQTRYLRTLVDTLPISVWLKDTAGRYLTINTGHIAVKGLTAEQMLGKTDEELWPGDIGTAFRAADIEVMETRHRKIEELAIPGEDGAIFWREIEKAPVIDDDGAVIGTVGVGRDISERKRYEQSLLAQAKLEQRLSALTANIPGFVYTIRLEPDGHASFPFASAGVEEIFGLRPEEIRNDANVLRARYHPDDLPRMFNTMEESVRTQKPFHAEIRIRNRNNEERWVEVRSIPQFLPDGSTEWHGIMLDITDRKDAENALCDSRKMLTEAQRIAHVGSWEMNLVDNVLSWSDEIYRIFEIDPQQFGASYEAFMDAVHPEDRELVDRAYQTSLENRQPFEIEHRLRLPDGRIKYVHEHCESYFDDGKPLRSLGTVQDITERKEMENSLRESRKMLTEAQRIAHVGSWEYDIANDIHTWSDELFRIYEVDPLKESASYDACLNATHPDDREAVARAYLDSLEAGMPYQSEHRLLMQDGRVKYVHERGETMCAADGTLLRAVGMMQDITERKRMEEALAAREREFRSLAENSPDNIARWDTAGRYLYINPTHERTLGVSLSDIVGMPVPDSREQVKAAIAQVIASGLPVQIEQRVSVNGNTEIHVVSLAPEFDEDGRVVSVLGIGRDMTDIYRMQDTIAEREREFRALADSSPGMMAGFYLRPDGSVCMPYVSPNIFELFGLHPQDVAEDASPLLSLNHPEDAQRVAETIAESARTMTTWHQEYRILHPVKGLRWMESNTNPQPHPDGGVIWYGYVFDITERKRAEEVLRFIAQGEWLNSGEIFLNA